jgi:hypothetical protein
MTPYSASARTRPIPLRASILLSALATGCILAACSGSSGGGGAAGSGGTSGTGAVTDAGKCSWPATLDSYATRFLLDCKEGSSSNYCFSDVFPTSCPANITGNIISNCDGVCDCAYVCKPGEYALQIGPGGLDAGEVSDLPANCRAAPGVVFSSIYSACCTCE